MADTNDYGFGETINGFVRELQPCHHAILKNSAIHNDVIEWEGYFSVTNRELLKSLGFTNPHIPLPGFAIPVFPPNHYDAEPSHYRYRPDNPGDGAKYLTPPGVTNRLDVPRLCHPALCEVWSGGRVTGEFVSL